jgi:hypothetical protein
MVWLWLLVPVLLFVVAAALWRTSVRLDRRREALEAQLTALRRPPTHR